MSSYKILSHIFGGFAVESMVKDRNKALLAYFIDKDNRLARVSLVTRDDCFAIKHLINEQINISDDSHSDTEMLDAIEKIMKDRFMFPKEIPALWLRNTDLYGHMADYNVWLDVIKRKISGKWRRI